MSTIQDFSGYTPTWCPGCGDWAIGVSIRQAFVQLGFTTSDVGVVFDIGCSGNMNDFLNAYAVHSLHGRSIPAAIGYKLANHKRPIVVIGGDGGIYGEGGNHFIHACRGNHAITVIVHDNSVYGLTTGQVAPTAQKGFKSKSTPLGIIEIPVNPLTLAISQGATFVAQAFSGDTPHLVEMIKAGIKHKGFSLVNVLQPCVTFNKMNTYQYYMQRVYKLGSDYNPKDYSNALLKAEEINKDKFPLGILYQIEKNVFHEQLPQLSNDIPLVDRQQFTDLSVLYEEFV